MTRVIPPETAYDVIKNWSHGWYFCSSFWKLAMFGVLFSAECVILYREYIESSQRCTKTIADGVQCEDQNPDEAMLALNFIELLNCFPTLLFFSILCVDWLLYEAASPEARLDMSGPRVRSDRSTQPAFAWAWDGNSQKWKHPTAVLIYAGLTLILSIANLIIYIRDLKHDCETQKESTDCRRGLPKLVEHMMMVLNIISLVGQLIGALAVERMVKYFGMRCCASITDISSDCCPTSPVEGANQLRIVPSPSDLNVRVESDSDADDYKGTQTALLSWAKRQDDYGTTYEDPNANG